jgi:deoxycytidylate deaminase
VLVYANFPVVHTDKIFEALSRYSGDPVTQVVAIAYDTETSIVSAYGVNRPVHGLEKIGAATIATPLADAKKFLMVHAEIDLLKKLKDIPPHRKETTAIILSLQPCMNCLASLIDNGFTKIFWKTENRHQHEQTLIAPFIPYNVEYKKLPEGLFLQIPKWICPENELT